MLPGHERRQARRHRPTLERSTPAPTAEDGPSAAAFHREGTSLVPARPAVAVIGATGFIGGALVSRLRDLGVATESFTRGRPFIDSRGALRGQWDAVNTVYWLAGSIRPATAAEDPAQGIADRHALQMLLDAIERERPDIRVVTAGSGGTVYDARQPAPYDEESPVSPANAYGAAMWELEQLVSSARDSAILRVANAYGPGQVARRGQGVVAHWMSNIAAGREVQLIGSEQVARDYVYVDDVVGALVRVHLQRSNVPQVINIGSGRPTTLGELLRLIEDVVAPTSVSVRREPGRSFDAASTWLDVSLAASTLDWRPTVELRDGLARTWRHVRIADRHPVGNEPEQRS
ncbi:MAG: NAD-dependent epimerase/dehydratase family protein [Actinomycetota bacterium]